jgi:hypothetical protein
MKRLIFILIFISTGIIHVIAQNDSIIFNNGNFIVGEAKTLDRNVFKIETDYSDNDFTIEWDGIKEIYTETFFLITLTDGSRYNGTLKTVEPGKIAILTDEGETIEVNVNDIVILDDLDQGFWNQLYASIDLGLDLTKANNFQQFSMRSNVGYMAKRWQLDANFNSLSTKQDDVDDILRNDGGLMFKYFLPQDWYPLVSIDFLANTDQQLDLRTTGKFGMGKYVIHTNKLYWGFSLGANYNNENYTLPATPDRKSWEGFLGTELNLFNIGDLSLLTKLVAYPSFTESGRWRSDFNFDAKYDLPFDFYVKLGYTLNFDNQPAEGSSNTDYVLHTGFGWEW